MTQTLAEFLLARITEDEADWLEEISNRAIFPDRPGSSVTIVPAKMLAECEAKRRIVKLHSSSRVCPTCAGDPSIVYGRRTGAALPTAKAMPCPTLRLLALPYADHPEFQPEWRV
jgi:hypothetical protein